MIIKYPKTPRKNRNVDYKDVILRKHTNSALSSEDFLKLKELVSVVQPGNTCPFIDAVQKNNQDDLYKVRKIYKQLEYYLGDRGEEDECCNNKENFDTNVKHVSDYCSNLSNIEDGLPEINDELENLRKDAENFRNTGNLIKDLLWELINHPENLDNVVNSYTIIKEDSENVYFKELFNYYKISKILKSFDKSIPYLADTFCRNKCQSYKQNQDLINAFEDIHSLDLECESDIGKAIDNVSKISFWVSDFQSALEQLIKDPNLLQLDVNNRIKFYEEALNFDSNHRTENFIKNICLKIYPIELNELIEREILSENLLEVKKITGFLQDFNKLITRYNQLNTLKSDNNYIEYQDLFDSLILDLESYNLSLLKPHSNKVYNLLEEIQKKMIYSLVDSYPQVIYVEI